MLKYKARILLVDDHPLLRQGLKSIINAEPDLKVCGEAESLHNALAAMDILQVDLAIIDLYLKQSNGLALLAQLKERCPGILLIVYSFSEEPDYVEQALRAGASGYVSKHEELPVLVEAIHQVLNGKVYLSKYLVKALGITPRSDLLPHIESVAQHLTPRELQVFELIGLGLTTKEIAQHLQLSFKTIESYREHIKVKLQIDGAAHLLKRAVHWVQSQYRSLQD